VQIIKVHVEHHISMAIPSPVTVLILIQNEQYMIRVRLPRCLEDLRDLEPWLGVKVFSGCKVET